MEIYYFGKNGEKIGPLTKEGLLNLAEVGVVTAETTFEVGGKKYKGKYIKNLRPIFEKLKTAEGSLSTQDKVADTATAIPPAAGGLSELIPVVGDEEMGQDSQTLDGTSPYDDPWGGYRNDSKTEQTGYGNEAEYFKQFKPLYNEDSNTSTRYTQARKRNISSGTKSHFFTFNTNTAEPSSSYKVVWWILTVLSVGIAVFLSIDILFEMVHTVKACVANDRTRDFRLIILSSFVGRNLIKIAAALVVFLIAKYLFSLAQELKSYNVDPESFFSNFWKTYRIIRVILVYTFMYNAVLTMLIMFISLVSFFFVYFPSQESLSIDFWLFCERTAPWCLFTSVSWSIGAFFTSTVTTLFYYWFVAAVYTAEDVRKIRQSSKKD